jgi:hypothetical protein
MTDILNKTTKIGDEHVDDTRDNYFNKVWWFKNNSSTSVIGDYTPGNHTSLHDISCGWGQPPLDDTDFNPQEAVAPDGLITKAIYDRFGSYAGLAQLRTNKPQAADDSNILTEPDIDTAVTTTDVVMEGILDKGSPPTDQSKPHQDTIHIISEELEKIEKRYHCFVDTGSSTSTDPAQTVTFTGDWGSHGWATYGDTLTAYIDLSFSTFLSARKWWNQGGKVTLDMDHTGTRDGSENWNIFLDTFGKLYFSMAGDVAGTAYGGVHWNGNNGSAAATSIVAYQHDGSVAYSNAGADLAADFGTSFAGGNEAGRKIVPYDYGSSYKLLFKAQQAANIYGGGGGGGDPSAEGAEVFVYGKLVVTSPDIHTWTFKVVLDNTKQGTTQNGSAIFRWGHIIPVNKALTVGAYTANFISETYSGFAKQSPTGTGSDAYGTWT